MKTLTQFQEDATSTAPVLSRRRDRSKYWSDNRPPSERVTRYALSPVRSHYYRLPTTVLRMFFLAVLGGRDSISTTYPFIPIMARQQ